jgi:hypothetical protein
MKATTPEVRYALELRYCRQYWRWLYAERKRADMEPSPEEKKAHPSHIALVSLRNS